MSKARLFVENIIVYGIGGAISKIIPLLMLPIVTRLMPGTEYFGISDLSNTIVSFCSALAVIGMYDAMYRLFFEREDKEYKKAICSTTLVFTVSMSIIVCILMIVFKEFISRFFFGNSKYEFLVYISAATVLVSATNSIISAPTRMENKRKVFLITNTVSPILSYSISLPLILSGHYIIALPLAAFIAGFSMEIIFLILNHDWFNIKLYNVKYLKPLLAIAVPLFPNFLIYWIFNSSDKVMITNLLGVGDAGIYSVGSKLGHASQLIYTAFAGGWQYFAFSTMKDDNQVKSNSMIFEYLGAISFVVSSFTCALSFFVYKILFSEQYVPGYIIAPYLFLAPLLQMLFQIAANQFLVVKKTWPNIFILGTGAVLNVCLNLILIPKIGIEGASIATLMGYLISDIICVIVLYRMKLIELESRFYFMTLLLIVFFVLWRLLFSTNAVVGCIAAFVYLVVVLLFYKKEIIMLKKKVKKNRSVT